MKKVLLIYGGNSSEHEISCKSKDFIVDNIDTNKYTLDTLYITKNNEYYLNNNIIVDIINTLKKYDIVFPIIHGNNGEDGKLQGMLDLFNIKYVGSKCGSSYICMDKIRTKQIISTLGIKQVPYQIYNKDINIEYPVIVKPSNGGSSIGISVVHNKKELNKAIKLAKKYDNKIIIEQFLDNIKEIECAVIKDKNKLFMEVGEINCHNTFYDYNTKYESNDIDINYNPDIDINLVKEYSKKIFNELELDNYARIDFFYHNNILYFNEVNTIPGFNSISMFPKLMEKHFTPSELITKLIENTKII